MASSLVALDILVVLALAYFVQRFAQRRRAPLPPGPPGLPWFGNVLQWPKEKDWVTFSRWGRKYGGLVHLTLYGRSVVIVNSPQVAFDMLNKKGAIYSDRTNRTMHELTALDQSVAQVQYGDHHRKLRALILQTLGTKATVTGFGEVLEMNWNRFLRRIIEQSGDLKLLDYTRQATGSVILHIVYGYEVKEGVDPVLKSAVDAVWIAGRLITHTPYLVDAFPALKRLPYWFPGAGFRRYALYVKNMIAKQRRLPHDWVRKQMAIGKAQPSFTVNHLRDSDLTPAKEELIRWASNSMFAAGFDTVASSVLTFFLAMTLNPTVQNAAQEEIDRVVGQDRLPTLSDWDSLPYVVALVKEVLRWHPVVPQGLPHRLMEDDIQDGYLIPKGTVIIPNIWNMLHDSDLYARPMEFDPSRFLGDLPERDPGEFCFGFGRRICPGLHLAEASIFVACAMNLAVFNIQKAKGPDGQPITPEVEWSSGLLSHALEFPCSITPRSAKASVLATAIDLNREAV